MKKNTYGKPVHPGTCKACGTALRPETSLGHKNGYELLPCHTCGTVTVAPIPTLEELNAFYQAYRGSKTYMPKAAKKIRRAGRRIRRLMRLTSGKHFLDVGCNCGFTVKAALDLGLSAHGIDIDAVAVETSRQSFGDHFTTLSIQEYAALGHKVDILHTSEVIEHVPESESFVAALAAVLASGGVLFLTTPDAGHPRKPKKFVEWSAVVPPGHLIYFTKDGLTRLFERHGFTDIHFKRTFKPGIRMTARKA